MRLTNSDSPRKTPPIIKKGIRNKLGINHTTTISIKKVEIIN